MKRTHALILGLISALALVLITATNVDFAPWFGKQVANGVSRAIGREVTIAGSIRLGLGFSGLRGQVTGMVIANPEWARNEDFASIDRAEVTFSWLPLMVGVFEPVRVRIRGALFELESRTSRSGHDATWHLGPLDPNYRPERNRGVRFDLLPRIDLTDIALALTDPYGVLHGIKLHSAVIKARGPGAHLVAAILDPDEEPGKDKAANADKTVSVKLSVASLADLRRDVSDVAFKVLSDAGTISMTGQVGLAPYAGFDVTADWSVSALGRFGRVIGLNRLPQDMPLSGALRVAGQGDAFAVRVGHVASGTTRFDGVLQGRLIRQGQGAVAGATMPGISLLELSGKLASERVNLMQLAGFLSGDAASTPLYSLSDMLFGPGLVVKLDLQISTPRADAGKVTLKDVSTRLTSDAGRLRLSQLKAKLGKGALLATVTSDTTGTEARTVLARFQARDFDLSVLTKVLGMPALLDAKADLSGELLATGESYGEMLRKLDGQVQFAVGRGVLRGATARALRLSANSGGEAGTAPDAGAPVRISCAAGRLGFSRGLGVVDRLTMRGADFALDVRGYADFAERVIDLRLSPRIVNPKADEVEEAPAADFMLTGPLATPRVRSARGAFVLPAEAGDVPIGMRTPGGDVLPALAGKSSWRNPCIAVLLVVPSPAPAQPPAGQTQ